MLQKNVARILKNMDIVAKSMLKGFWHFLKCCKIHVARILKILATLFFQMVQKKKPMLSNHPRDRPNKNSIPFYGERPQRMAG